ncbi:LacI family DNA-binding transcriptional regulator [Erysipelothrix sp. HDW6C]|uniref:LacI family DNA-binding transcriptional regulator n=1 Tax=Erysipelothrix sp. HDW6C TaxID=2714930 RepID=UPI00140E8628|nr:LacI family DNA-binding transcriptional regulator [Erysipelothrix sp. HDW6C]QIK69286.1 LacI family DNA-binding transcriptional regulator [Erysipelothrix sp. HDW6C]
MTRKSKITINDIASLAGTSKTTVSFYLNGKYDKMSADTRQRIEAVIQETNYSPSAVARSLNAKSMKLIGVIIGDITNDFANKIVKGIDDTAKIDNYQLIVGNSNYEFENEEKYVDRMLALGVDGFIVQPTTQFKSLIPKIKANNKALVFIDSQTDMQNNSWVKTNNYEAVLETTLKMIDLGYDEFIMITADPSVLSTRQERTQGFIDALAMRDRDCQMEIVDYEVTSDQIQDRISKHLNLGKKTLVFAANCWLLPIVYMGIKPYKNLIPETIGLLGFDNTEWTQFSSPSVTTIVQPAYEEGSVAVRILIDKIEAINNEVPTQILKCVVNWEESTLKHQ